ncbi:MAG: phosphoglycerate dehydrogenase [Bacteroidetes bacterium]|nr:phosphoglycerate dehydrogenase [Bacteroidota bacterium]
MKVLIADAVDQRVEGLFKSAGIDCDYKAGIKKEQLLDIIGNYDGLVVRSSTQVTPDVIDRAGNLKIVGRAGAGVDNIDVKACSKKGILVMNTPGGNTISTAEHTCALILSVARWTPTAFHDIRLGKWERKKWTGTELDGKTLGIIGLGKIGKEVASRMQAFGMKTIGYDPFMSKESATGIGIELFTVDEIYSKADFITFHTPLNAETKYLFNEKSLQLVKKGVKIVNCARGGIVQEQAIVSGLKSGLLGGYAADVTETEPPTFQEPLFSEERAIVTPHLGASTEEAQEKVAIQIAEQMIDAFAQKDIKGAVNGLALQFAFDPDSKPYVELAENIGQILGQIENSSFRKIEFIYGGKLPSKFSEILLNAALKGIFSNKTTEPVNYINARLFAEEMGIRFSESRQTLGVKDYTNSLQVSVEYGNGKTRSVVGSVFNDTEGRLVRIDDYDMEIKFEGDFLFYENEDRPGMLAQVGAILAESQVNIGSLVLGRKKENKKALTVLTVDSGLDETILKRINQVQGVISSVYVRLN